jgi:hypothetical protein
MDRRGPLGQRWPIDSARVAEHWRRPKNYPRRLASRLGTYENAKATLDMGQVADVTVPARYLGVPLKESGR